MSMDKARDFARRHQVLLVCIPGLIGLHYWWHLIQQNKKFVAEHERREFPPITLYRHARYLVGLGPEPPRHPPPPGTPID